MINNKLSRNPYFLISVGNVSTKVDKPRGKYIMGVSNLVAALRRLVIAARFSPEGMSPKSVGSPKGMSPKSVGSPKGMSPESGGHSPFTIHH